jgi:hypothetical protein
VSKREGYLCFLLSRVSKFSCIVGGGIIREMEVPYFEGELVLVGGIHIVRPATLDPVPVDGLIHEPGKEGGEWLLGVTVHGSEVQHLISVQRVCQLLECPEAAQGHVQMIRK